MMIHWIALFVLQRTDLYCIMMVIKGDEFMKKVIIAGIVLVLIARLATGVVKISENKKVEQALKAKQEVMEYLQSIVFDEDLTVALVKEDEENFFYYPPRKDDLSELELILDSLTAENIYNDLSSGPEGGYQLSIVGNNPKEYCQFNCSDMGRITVSFDEENSLNSTGPWWIQSGELERFIIDTVNAKALDNEGRKPGQENNVLIDGQAVKKFEEIITAKMEEGLRAYSANPGQFRTYELTEFYLSDTVTEDDGAVVEIYSFDFGLIPDKPEEIGWVGGMRFDDAGRIIQTNYEGPLAVRSRNGEIVATAWMGADYNAMVDAHSESFITYMLDEAENQN